MKKIRFCVLLFTLSIFTLHLNAQSVADLWISMPKEIVPYIDLNMRKEMIECQKMGVDTSVKNKFEGKTVIDTLTTDYGRFALSNSRTLELAKLPCETDSIIMMIDTYKAPEAQGRVSFYDLKWNRLSAEDKLPMLSVDDLLVKPDTMTVEVYEDLRKLISPELIVYNYDFKGKILEISLSQPLVTLKEKEQLNAIISKRKLKWVGNIFN